MPGNTKQLKKDVDQKPAPQYFDPVLDEYGYLYGSNGATRHIIYGANGEPISTTGNKLAVRATEMETTLGTLLTKTGFDAKVDLALSALRDALRGTGNKSLTDLATTQAALAAVIGEAAAAPTANTILARLKSLEDKIDAITTGTTPAVTQLTGSILDKVDLSNQLLASINHGQLSPIAISSWQEIQYIVRSGLGPKVFRVGDQFISQYDTGEVVWDVIGIDHDTPSDAQFQHSLTLQAHDCIGNVQFDAPEALYYAEEELPAGEQVFTDSGGDKYKFTTTLPVPSGGQIVLGGWPSKGYVATTATTYAADRITIIESGITVIPTDTGADTLTEVNNRSRCRYGSNNYVESAIKQWLNSEATSFNWVPKTNFDRPPTGAPYTGAGFLKLLDPELVSVLGAVDKQVTRNTITDGGGQDLFSDKVFLLSRVEVFGGTEGTTTGEQAYPYYSTLAANPTTAALAGRIKYLNGSARIWWLRSPYTGSADIPCLVGTSGAVNYSSASYAYGAAPACCIV